MTASDVSEELSDGHAHTIPCPAERHEDDPEPPMLYVRHLTRDRAWLLHCWSRPTCSYREIAALLNIETRSRRGSPFEHLVAAYDHADPDEPPRLVFHSWRDDAVSGVSNEEHNLREARFRGSANATHLMLWAPEEADWTGHTLVVVGSEEEAISLMRAGVYRDGFVPVTWYRARRRIEEDRDAVDRVDWSRVHDRRVLFWPAHRTAAYAEMYHAAGMATAAGATGLLMVDTRSTGLDEGDNASALSGLDEVIAVLGRIRVLPGLHDDDADSDLSPDGAVDPDAEMGTDTAAEIPDMEEMLKPGVENATDAAMAVRLLREHGHRMVLASRPEGSDATVEVYWRTNTGVLERRPAEVGIALWRSRDQYMEELLALRDTGRISPDEFMQCVQYVNGAVSAAGRRTVVENLGLAHAILREHAAVPAGLRFVPSQIIDADTRYLGAPNGVIDLDSGRLLSRTEARGALVSRTIPDPYDPEARDPHVDRLTSHMSEEERERLLDALGYALRGGPVDRLYVVDGGRSRTVLLRSVRLALGPRYSGAAPLGLLLSGHDRREDRAGPTELYRFVGPRILVGSAPAGSGSLDPGLLRDLDAGGRHQGAYAQSRPEG